jgi:hypothetical protein
MTTSNYILIIKLKLGETKHALISYLEANVLIRESGSPTAVWVLSPRVSRRDYRVQ